ncbi:MAG TPA: FAD-binding protein [Herpetosiphonaceae bacterium]
MTTNLKNWAGNYTYSAARLHAPTTTEELQALVRGHSRVKALGTRHSFNSIADTSEDLISLEHFDRIVALDRDRRTVTVEAGTRYGQLCQYLHREGFALHNMGSLPHISVGGACATGTHGSGVDNRNLAGAVAALELVTADGEIVTLSREHDADFPGMVINLGGLGIVTRLTLDLVPAFEMRQDLYQNLPLAQLEQHFDEVVSSGYSVSLFTDWRSATFNQVWLKRLATDGAASEAAPLLFEATRATRQLHPIDGMPVENCTQQLGVAGPWHERLPHFRMEFTPSSGEELQSEYFVPRQYAFAALHAIDSLREHVAPLLLISEIRTIAADDLWLSPCYEQPCVAIHFTWAQNWPAVQQVLPLIEERLAPLDARPHWGKLFTMAPARLQTLYPRLPDFQRLLRAYDPQGKFRNAFLETYVVDAD